MTRIDVLDLPEDVRDLVLACEVSGAHTVFERNGKAVAMLVSRDEYMAMSETIAIANDALLFARLAEADEDEVESRGVYERLRFAKSAERVFDASFRTIETNPIAGAPLFEPLKGLWSYRTADLRIIYKIVADARIVVILSITRT